LSRRLAHEIVRRCASALLAYRASPAIAFHPVDLMTCFCRNAGPDDPLIVFFAIAIATSVLANTGGTVICGQQF